MEMILLNFSSPLKEMELHKLDSLAGQKVRVINLPLEVDIALEQIPQVSRLLGRLKDFENDLRSEPVWVNLPVQSSVAAIITIYLSKWLGCPPVILRTRIMTMGLIPYHEILEIVDLAKV